MRICKLYIQNFMCYDDAYIDFNQFSSALVVGRSENSSGESNGVGKTSLFRAIEYVLFNHSDVNLEHIIRDDADKCIITLDFIEGDQEYRVTRTRTRKGASDISFFQKNGTDGTEEEVYHSINGDRYTPTFSDKYWKDISGRRTSDTEKDLSKLIKVNLKSFRIFVHFMQHDFGGLATATAETRKKILKDALNLIIYSKLEKIAKEKFSILSKESDKFSTLIENLGNPDQTLIDLSVKLAEIEKEIIEKSNNVQVITDNITKVNENINKLTEEHANLESKFSNLVSKEHGLNIEKNRLEISIKEYTTKKSNVVQSAKELIAEVKSLEETQAKLIKLDYNQIDILSEKIVENKEKIAQLNIICQNDLSRIEKLQKPIPENGECEECHQIISPEHRSVCQEKLNIELKERQNNLKQSKKDISALISENSTNQQTISQLNLSKQHLESVNLKISTKKKEIADKRNLHIEYQDLLNKFNNDLLNKQDEIKVNSKELESSSIEEAKKIQKLIQDEKGTQQKINNTLSTLNKELTHFNSAKAVIQHDINQKTEDKRKIVEYKKLLSEINEKLTVYPHVIQGFSSTGIPNLIIQNVLDDLQLETNNLLNQLKPGLQLSFIIEKTVEKTGDQTDTLDIIYTVNGKKRYYENISGAMQMAVNFSLKLGLSFLLQKLSGVDVRFLLLDEITQSFDSSRVDFFMDIVKFFQKDYTILVITHDDRLKDKFSHAILVEQDINMVSRAKVVSSW